MNPHTPDLFATAADDERSVNSALAEHSLWFEAWLADASEQRRVRHASSETVYRSMWGGFVKWCVAQNPPARLFSLEAEDLKAFIASRTGLSDSGDLSARHTWRVLHLIDRVLRFASRTLDADVANPVDCVMVDLQVVYVNSEAAGVPDHLPASEAKRLVTFLSSLRPRSASVVANTGMRHTWQDLRNRASVGLQLGAGLTPGDVRALTLASVVVDGGTHRGLPWKLKVPADGSTPERETPIAQWAGQLLRYWLQVRLERSIPGTWLFPSTSTGKPWQKTAQYEAVQQVLEQAEIDAVKGGSFRLRHTFALRQLRRGKHPADVARWMGILDPVYMDRYARVVHRAVDVV